METNQQEPGISYQYNPLKDAKSIRLLYLHPGSYHQLPIKISLREFLIDACPHFAALSYTWGTEDGITALSRELLCEEKSIKIAENCEAALKRLRQSEGDRVLWVDAICIDQSNIEERSIQIGLMRHIYSQATWTGLWVGETSSAIDEESSKPLSDLGMDYIHDFAVEIVERMNLGQDPTGGPLYQEFIKDRKAFQYSNNEVFTPRKRLWVIQEVALSKSPMLLCGGKVEPFHNLKIVIETLIRPEQPAGVMEFNCLFIGYAFHQFDVRNMIQADETSEISPPGVKALRVLNATRNTQATDPRDKIYGILGFFGPSGIDSENIFPEPNYRKTGAELYADVSRAIITNTGNLDILSSCHGFFEWSVPNLPSWAACWNDIPLKFFDDAIFNAAGSSTVIYEDFDDKLALRIKGKKIDTLKLTGQLPDSIGYSNEACIELWRYWWKFASALESYPTGDTVSEAFQDTLCWGMDPEYRRLGLEEYRETFDAWLKILTGPDDTATAAISVFTGNKSFTYAHRATSITWARNMGITEKGYLAMVSLTSQVGDDIVIFQGAKLPYIVRTEDGKSKLFAITESIQGANELEWFTLW
ncbi:heterokaryon incompatibility domain-containing protein [Trichoderma barbatum]